MTTLSIIVPVLNEASGIKAALQALSPCRDRGAELIVVDGGSDDDTRALARAHCDHVIVAPRGRASQMNAGVRQATGDVLLFLHADTTLPPDGDSFLLCAVGDRDRVWGRFDVQIEGRHPLLGMVSAMMNLRSRITGIATGDQAIFVTRAAFDACGGYPPIPLMEDIAISRALRRESRPVCLAARVTTSGRRWEQNGVFRTIWTMWRLRLSYFLGADPASLERRYHAPSRSA